MTPEEIHEILCEELRTLSNEKLRLYLLGGSGEFLGITAGKMADEDGVVPTGNLSVAVFEASPSELQIAVETVANEKGIKA